MPSDIARQTALVALGANLGDPLATLSWAKEQLQQVGEVIAASRVYRTAPVGGPDGQPDYLNAAVSLRTALSPADLLRALLNLEQAAGRERRERWGPRVLDLDLLAVNGMVLRTPELTLPHPRLMERAFVLAPLAEIAPSWSHPLLGTSVRVALGRLDASGVKPLTSVW
ncbi:2-amino-4-hydroxy-6-hydroxymethyldihydropteridine diphosphokinase [Deinococcus peraridilitoris]|uniref:2-amino-4-hydroxy-6-hydroxymethyldihydropteridine diphosphokinase n=1 Tax=Deinococcus peraridilitoris (strain DSM 19664 / LMG 22246 / CIP 109416 / KR-200) TaxID=937777 RepID=L0A4L2_DEIPD|nr:2-amino-4-hydroxy-6-hydroxymethyldihydropteridine diphosphokinase [Deinococcus peraridilitoris]AFZ68374.1 2-amino-4-hydroxy-6-hydroxymethyldihydropteridine pyrophosphokinase [Deinococcus peraridilitoris DSM 19664]